MSERAPSGILMRCLTCGSDDRKARNLVQPFGAKRGKTSFCTDIWHGSEPRSIEETERVTDADIAAVRRYTGVDEVPFAAFNRMLAERDSLLTRVGELEELQAAWEVASREMGAEIGKLEGLRKHAEDAAFENARLYAIAVDEYQACRSEREELREALEEAKHKLEMLERGGEVARGCTHHGSEDCESFECAAGDCHFIPAEHMLAAIRGDLPVRVLARFLGDDVGAAARVLSSRETTDSPTESREEGNAPG